jgi:hypothetical protein
MERQVSRQMHRRLQNILVCESAAWQDVKKISEFEYFVRPSLKSEIQFGNGIFFICMLGCILFHENSKIVYSGGIWLNMSYSSLLIKHN